MGVVVIPEPEDHKPKINKPKIHKTDQRRVFMAHIKANLKYDETATRLNVLEWAGEEIDGKKKYEPNEINSLRNFLAGDTKFTYREDILYDYCKDRGCPAGRGAFDGCDDVGDVLATFAEKNAKSTLSLGLGGTYDVYRLGSLSVESNVGKPILMSPHKLEITAEPSSPHASFVYIDTARAHVDKPDANKIGWSGRVVATRDAIYLIGVSENESDAVTFILWGHHIRNDMLVGMQFAKLASPNPEDDANPEGDDRDLVIARRIVAVAAKPGRKPAAIDPAITEWLTSSPLGAVIRIDEPTKPKSNSD